MSFLIVFTNRLLKVVGTILKTLSYVFHFIFPNKRFTIPKQSSPWIKSKSVYKIPKIIWQTNFTNRVTLPVYLNYLCNRIMSPDYEYRYVSTEARQEFLKEHAPKDVSDAYEQLTDGASQADLWRMFVLNYYGGIYMDIDAHTVWPLSKIIKPEDKELFLLTKKHYTNYFIASEKNNPIIEKTLEIIISNIEKRDVAGGVYNLTGPNTLNLAIGGQKVNSRFYRITCVQGSFTNEYFQYVDKPNGKWIHAKRENLLKQDSKD